MIDTKEIKKCELEEMIFCLVMNVKNSATVTSLMAFFLH